MATIVRTESGRWKAMVRKQGWPQQIRTFRIRRMAEDWARGVEDQIARGVFQPAKNAARLTLADAIDRYLATVTPAKKPTSAVRDHSRAATRTPRAVHARIADA